MLCMHISVSRHVRRTKRKTDFSKSNNELFPSLYLCLLQFFRDVAWEREILSLRVNCKTNERGCDWTGQIRHYEVAYCN